MRKLITILLLTVFCNSLFYYGYFSVSLMKARLDAQLALAKTNSQNSFGILKVPVRLLQKDESDEVWYKDKLYDVVERDRINDTLYVFLLRDEHEQDLLARGEKLFRDNCNVLSHSGLEVSALKNALSITDSEDMQTYPLGLLRRDCPIKPALAPNNAAFFDVYAETPFPPPRQA